MSIEQVGATTVTNVSGNSRKFYTIHVLGDLEVRQYGRIGTVGQFQHIQHPGKRAAEASAEKQITAKERKGYGDRKTVLYALDERYFTRKPSELNQIIHNAHLAEKSSEIDGMFIPGQVHEPDDEPDVHTPEYVAAFESFNERALNVIGAAAGGSTEAATTYATLREEFEGMEEGFERCQSLLETLEVMLTSEASA